MNSFQSSLVLIVGLFMAQFVLTGMYFALANSRQKNLKDRADTGIHRAERTHKLVDNTPLLLNIHQLLSGGIVLAMAITAQASLIPELDNALQSVGVVEPWSTPLALTLLMTCGAVLLLFIGHQLPSALVPASPERFAMFITPFAELVIWSLAPLVNILQRFSQRLGKRLGGAGATPLIIEEEIKILVDAGSEEGIIEDDEKLMIYSVFKFGDTLVREVMVPRIDVVAIDVNVTLAEAIQTIIRAGHSRIPVYEESIDNIKGFLYAKDLFSVWQNNSEATFVLERILRPPFFVPDSKKADELLAELQNREIHIAIVIDEYGGTSGLVTLEDLIEEIVGEIRDEYDFLEEAVYEAVSKTEYICNAGIDLDDLNELLEISLPTEDNDTLGGYIFSQLGRVPKVGDALTNNGVEIEVLTIEGRRIHKVRVKKVPRETNGQTPTENLEEVVSQHDPS